MYQKKLFTKNIFTKNTCLKQKKNHILHQIKINSFLEIITQTFFHTKLHLIMSDIFTSTGSTGDNTSKPTKDNKPTKDDKTNGGGFSSTGANKNSSSIDQPSMGDGQ